MVLKQKGKFCFKERFCLNMQCAHSSVTNFPCPDVCNGSAALPSGISPQHHPLWSVPVISAKHSLHEPVKRSSQITILSAWSAKADNVNDTKIWLTLQFTSVAGGWKILPGNACSVKGVGPKERINCQQKLVAIDGHVLKTLMLYTHMHSYSNTSIISLTYSVQKHI